MFASIIIYTYDRKKYILNALNSVISQSIPRNNYEIIVVKGYKDEVIDKEIDRLADVNLVIDEKAHGKKLSPAIYQAKGEIVFVLDDDDEFTSKKLERIIPLFEKNEDLLFVHNSFEKIDGNTNPLEEMEAAPGGLIWLDTNDIKHRSLSLFLRYRANWYSSCMAFRRNALLENRHYLEKVDQSVDPFLFFMILSARGKLLIINERLTRYRVHESTTNYSVSFEEFVSRKGEFYDNTLKNYRMALEMKGTEDAQKVVRASIAHMNAISIFFKTSANRRTLFRSLLKLIFSYRIALNRYLLTWSALLLMRIIIGYKAVYIFYRRTSS